MNSDRGSLLVIDDNSSNRDLLSRRLMQQGYAVTVGEDGYQALRMIDTQQFDVVILDIMMPGISGLEVLKTVRQKYSIADLPIIMATARDQREDIVTALKLGANDYVTKPLEFPVLFARTETQLRVKRAQNARLSEQAKMVEVVHMLGNISHDIKNMLMPVVCGAALLQDEVNEMLDALPEIDVTKLRTNFQMCNEVIRMLRDNSSRIDVSVREIADCVKGLTRPPAFASCQVVNIVASVTNALACVAKGKNVALRSEGLDGLPTVLADEHLLFSAFYNLTNNALAEVPSGGVITIHGQADHGGGALLLSVADNGPGMPQEVRERLFSASAISKKAGGTGLGTKIVKDVMDTHGAQIRVDSELGVGTTFHIRLPFVPPRALPA